ncbi:MarR family transcriptional regulator [Devosia sp. D6-9]|nr:MarR family transcriptional regulator [Devosia sp. D6-9]
MASSADDQWIDAETKIVDAPGDHHDPLRLWLRLFSASRIVEAEVRRRLTREFDITLPRFDLLSQLYRVDDGLVLGEISKRLMVSAGNITAIVDRLSTEGYITRTADPKDRRVQIIRMTAEGRAYFATMAAAHEAWIDEMFSGMSAEDTRALLGLLGKAKVSARKALQGEE